MANAKGFEGVNISIAPLALRKAGIILESEGKKADALKLYQEIKTKVCNVSKCIKILISTLSVQATNFYPEMSTALHNLSDYDLASVPDASNMCFGIIVSEWNPDITGALLDGAVRTLEKHGAIPENIHVKTVPGSFELVYGAHQMTLNGGYDAIIILGSVIRGETPHFDYICQGVTYGISRLNANDRNTYSVWSTYNKTTYNKLRIEVVESLE